MTERMKLVFLKVILLPLFFCLPHIFMRACCNFLTPVSLNTLLYSLLLRGIGRSRERGISSSPVPFLPKEGSVVLGLLWPDNDYPIIYFSFCKITEMLLLSHGYYVDEFIILEGF